jgi:hypothetical protein
VVKVAATLFGLLFVAAAQNEPIIQTSTLKSFSSNPGISPHDHDFIVRFFTADWRADAIRGGRP